MYYPESILWKHMTKLRYRVTVWLNRCFYCFINFLSLYHISVNQSKTKKFVFWAGSYCCQETLSFFFFYFNYFYIMEKLTENSLTWQVRFFESKKFSPNTIVLRHGLTRTSQSPLSSILNSVKQRKDIKLLMICCKDDN